MSPRQDAFAQALAERRATLAARIENIEWLTQNGVGIEEAAIRAGWSSLSAAESALRRAGHPLSSAIKQAQRTAA